MQKRDPSWQADYKLWPAGVCHRVVSSGERLNVAYWANVTGGFADKWTHHSDSFDMKSWERVANDEMWHAKYVIYMCNYYNCGQNSLIYVVVQKIFCVLVSLSQKEPT